MISSDQKTITFFLLEALIIFGASFVVSFLGTLPLGVLNTTASHVAMNQGIIAACYFMLGAILIEIPYSLIAILGSVYIYKNEYLFTVFKFVSSFLMLCIGFWYLIHNPIAMNMSVMMTPIGKTHLFVLGIVLSTLNVAGIPFWLFWGTHLIKKGFLSIKPISIFLYALGIATGTLFGFLLFIKASNFLFKTLTINTLVSQHIIGVILIFVAFFQILQSFQRKS